MNHREIVGQRPSQFAAFRPYILIPGKRSIVATDGAEPGFLIGVGGFSEVGETKFYGNGGVNVGSRYVYESDEAYQKAVAKLEAEKCKNVPRSSLAF